jgi:pimeloyl-ACP methyl ester carboxylesterase
MPADSEKGARQTITLPYLHRMNARKKRYLRRLLLTSAGLYLLGGLLLFLAQDLLFFHPRAIPRSQRLAFSQPFEEINLPIGNENLSGVRFPAEGLKKGLVVFYHGNMRNVEHYAAYPPLFTARGYEVWMMDYPGFGKTTGRRTGERILADALRFFDTASRGVPPEQVLIYGKSIGTGIAAYTAARRPHRTLLLETPYYSTLALAKHYAPVYPVGWLIRYRFLTSDYLKTMDGPTLIFHGTDDEIIPYSQAARLAAENRGTKLVTIEGGSHNNLAQFRTFRSALDSLLKQ